MQQQSRFEISRRLCLSITAKSVPLLRKKIELARKFKPGLLELRLDHIENLDKKKLKLVGKLLKGNEILTLRSKSEGGNKKLSESNRASLIRNGLMSLEPKFVDVEIATLNKYPQILRDIEKKKIRLIASVHDLEGKKSFIELREIIWQAPLGSKSLYAIKIVTEAKTIEENEKILKLYSSKVFESRNAPKLIAFCTGEKGVESRIRCLLAGSPFSYCSLPGEPLASGQLDIEIMRDAIGKRFE